MRQDGVTITELMIVVAIMAILMTIAGLSYSRMTSTYRLESQVRVLYTDLLNARVQAMQKNRIYFVAFAADYASYSVIEDTNDSGGLVPNAGDTTAWTKKLIYAPLPVWTNRTVALDARGLVSPNNTIRFVINNVTASYDCITLSATRIRMGHLNESSNCIAN